jgi:amino acid transporter
MIFDYVMNPIISVIWCSKAAMSLMNFQPDEKTAFAVFAVFFTILFTAMNLRGIEASSRTNAIISAGLGVVIVLFLGAAVRYLWLQPPAGLAGWTRPFYDPQTYSFSVVSGGAALAVLTYIGFDGISTLSEEVHNPRRNILLATVLVCLITGVLASIQVYAAQLIWPQTTFPDTDTAFLHVAGKAGGRWLFVTLNLALLVAQIGSGAGAHLGAGRLLYGMGRGNALPRSFFGVIEPKRRVPRNNIIAVGVFALLGAAALEFYSARLGGGAYEIGAQTLNFGAFIAFMGVNAAAFVHYLRNHKRSFGTLVPPVLGFLICGYIWLSLSRPAQIVGAVWMGLGILYGAIKTRGFRSELVNFELGPED